MKIDKYIRNYIGGKLVDPIPNEYLDNYNPATGEVYSFIPNSDHRDIEMAVESAKQAFEEWSLAPIEKRFKILMRIADLIYQNIDFMAMAESNDNGKPFALARKVDIPRAVDNFRFFATAVNHFASEAHPMRNKAINYTLRQPLGIVGAISPWNLPLYLFSWKIAPALATGNCVIAKPSEITPMTAYLLSKICIEAGLPPGVLNIVHGLGNKTGQAIVEHPDIKGITFTGGTSTGKAIAAKAAPMFKKLSLELGGKNPNIIFADCDFDKMLATTMRSSFSNQGQICLCGSRIFIEKPIYEKFKTAFIKQASLISVGDPESPNTQMGAIVSKQHRDKILSYITLAKEEGGTILHGGEIPEVNKRCKNGYFIQPTIIEGLPFDCRTNQEEIFGPVVTIMPFETEEEVLMYANSTEYGLAATLWTENLTRAHRMAQQIHSGVVWVNCWLLRDLRTPFGGMKSSGVGREGGWEAMRFFTEPKNICIQYN
jgi:aminomuconate-semialdehyde/2-hydroxymuconate-6-semialdehyde dehydrogenase